MRARSGRNAVRKAEGKKGELSFDNQKAFYVLISTDIHYFSRGFSFGKMAMKLLMKGLIFSSVKSLSRAKANEFKTLERRIIDFGSWFECLSGFSYGEEINDI